MTWTNQGLALRQSLERAVRGARRVGDRIGTCPTVPVSILEAILDAHPVDEGPLDVKVVGRDGEEIPTTKIEVTVEGAWF